MKLKRILAAVTAAVVVAGSSVAAETTGLLTPAAYAATIDAEIIENGFKVLVLDGVPTLMDYTGSEENVTIPSTFGGYTLTTIGSYAFSSCKSIKSITIPSTVTTIEDSAFRNCTALTSITIPGTVTSLGKMVFEYCTALESITIENGVESIGDRAFTDCTALTSVTIPDSVTSLGTWLFSGCSSLKSIEVSANNQSYSSVDGVLFSKDKKTIVTYPSAKDSASYSIPGGVTTIGKYAFYNCLSLTNVTIPSGLKSIGDHAFESSVFLKSINIPDGVTSIGSSAFYNCFRLADVTIPDSVTSIGDAAFCFCYELKSINIPSSVTVIDGYTFMYCTALESVTIPKSVTSIEIQAFYKCDSLNHIHIPYGTTAADYIRKGYLPDNESYYYVLNSDGSCPDGDNCPNKPPVKVNPVPQNLTATAGDGKVVLTWDEVPGATAYTVKGGTDATIYAKSIKTNTTTVTGLKNGTTYTFRVFAYVNGKWSAAAAVKATPVTTTPQNVKATAGDGKVVLTWDEVPGATAYTVKGGSDSTIYARSIKTNTATVTGLKNGTTYIFRVFAYVDGKWSAAAVVKATPVTTTPQNVKATVGNGKVTLTWDEVPGATAYTVKGGSDSTIYAKSIKTNTTTVTGLKNGTTYIFRVFAYAGGKWSAAAVVRATPKA